jgi:ubiquinol-cytochrome c reductase cytochrome c1 subunit
MFRQAYPSRSWASRRLRPQNKVQKGSFTMKNGFVKSLLLAALISTVSGGMGMAAESARHPEPQAWSFSGFMGTYDRDALRRGYKVYKEVCASCHSMKQLTFRNLLQKGGPEFSEAEVKAIAAEYTVTDGPDSYGEMFERSALPRDHFVAPYPNENAARAANGGAYPPDLSLINKARSGGPDYIYAILTGYEDAPAGKVLRAGQYYNPYMPGEIIAMPVPLNEDQVEYTDGTPATVAQMSSDVVHFLNWAAEPELEARKRIGFMALIYLVIFAGLLYFSMRKVWSDQH